jgi:hypothetical protein
MRPEDHVLPGLCNPGAQAGEINIGVIKTGQEQAADGVPIEPSLYVARSTSKTLGTAGGVAITTTWRHCRDREDLR